MRILVVSGTGTGVGKTVVTAAISAVAAAAGGTVAVVKPAQTGVLHGEPGDLSEVARLTGISELFEFGRFPDPLSPAAAARMSGLPPVDIRECAARVMQLSTEHDLVVVEGAGGLLVQFDQDGATIADLAALIGAAVVVVAPAGLGTLNHTALTLEALSHRGLPLAGVVIGEWPSDPDLAACCNIADLESIAAAPLAGALPAGSGVVQRQEFLDRAVASLGPTLGGSFDSAAFRRTNDRAAVGRSTATPREQQP